MHFVPFLMPKHPSTFTKTTTKEESQKSANFKICPFMTLRPLPKWLSMSTCVIHFTPLHSTPAHFNAQQTCFEARYIHIYVMVHNRMFVHLQQQQRHLSVITPICFHLESENHPHIFRDVLVYHFAPN